MMRKHHIHIVSLILFSILFTSFPGTARADQIPDSMALELLSLINEARRDPLAMAGALGLDPNQVLNDLPELAELLTYGLPALILNQQLCDAALSHTRDMLDNNYYGTASPDGRSLADRIADSSYDPVMTGETLSVLAFYNFIGWDTAVQILFKNMFLDELDPQRTEPRNILNPYMENVGIGIETGVMNFGYGYYNVYLATCDFASSFTMENAEMALLHLINQARKKPLAVAASLGMDPDQVLADHPELHDILTGGLLPLGLDENLHAAAEAHNREMLENGYYDHDSLDGRTYEERIQEAGYPVTPTGESLGRLDFDTFTETADAVMTIFESMFLDELDPLSTEKPNILNPDFSEVGIGFGVLEPDGLLSGAYSATCDFGAGAGGKDPYVTGVVYRDLDGDGLYTPDEGVCGITVAFEVWIYPFGIYESYDMITDETGGFGVFVKPGFCRLTARLPEKSEIYEVRVRTENIRVDFRMDGFNPEPLNSEP
jgi:uncharacterized protein YkwD